MNSSNHDLKDQKIDRIINHKILRIGAGIIAFLLPILTYFLSGEGERLNSISQSYWTDSRDIFVGSLIAVAFFLSAYNGTGTCNRDSEYMLSKLAGLCAVIVALFPTKDGEKETEIPQWIDFISCGYNVAIHYIAAVILFLCLFCLITFFARRAYYKDKVGRSIIYTLISWAMVIGLPLTHIIVTSMGRKDSLFWVELVGLWLFGIGWLIAGSYKTDSEKYNSSELQYIKMVNVEASELNYPSGLKVKPNEKYFFKAEGCWKDWFISCGPNGWGPKWKWFTSRNRVNDQPFFMLCGKIGKIKDDSNFTFKIGHESEWIVPQEVSEIPESERFIYFFANDMESKYCNNSRSMLVRIYKIG